MGAGRQYGLLFILPAIVVLALLIVYPIAYTGLLSVIDDQGNYVGAANYAAVIGNLIFHQFTDDELAALGATLRRHARVILAFEPSRRRRFSGSDSSGCRCSGGRR